MIEEQEDVDGIGVRVDENGFAVYLEGMREGLAGVRNDAVSDFKAINIRLMFRIAAEGIADGIGGETEEGQEQEKLRKRGPIVDGECRAGVRGRAEGAWW